nr:putative B3 domain-containing protein At1g78640 [Ipomoea trifida]
MCSAVSSFTYTYSENSAMESVSSNSTTTTLEDHQQPPLLLAPNHHQQITGSEEHPGAEGNHHHHWIHKRLSTSDVNLSARLLLPKEEIIKYVLPLMDMESCRACENRDGLRVKIWDLDTESEHQLSLKQWKTGSFLLTSNWIIEFVKRRSLLQGETISMCWDFENLRNGVFCQFAEKNQFHGGMDLAGSDGRLCKIFPFV